MAKNETLIPVCKYYKGGDKNPFDQKTIAYSFWELEWMWVNMAYGTDANLEYTEDYLIDFGMSLENISSNIPLSLKSFMYFQHCQRGRSKDGFKDFLIAFLN